MKPDITPDPGTQAIPVHHYDEDTARNAWEDYKHLCAQEAELRAKRIAAHQRFMAAFTAGVDE